MLSAEETQASLTGAWRLMLGKADGLRLLDLTADGFWNSFFAIAVAAPALIVGWVGIANEIVQLAFGLVLGATKYRNKIEHIAIPLRDVFAAFFFLNFGLALNPAEFPGVLGPVLLAVRMTIVPNILAGQFVAWVRLQAMV